MALPTTRVYLRSPYYVNLSRANLEKIVVELYIYTGTLTTDKPADYQYYLYATAFDGYAEVDISQLAWDFININFDGDLVTNAVWLEWDLKYADVGDTTLTTQGSYTALGLAGYGYFEDGYNPTPSTYIQQSTNYIVAPKYEGVIVPVLQDKLTQYIIARGGFQIYNSGALSTTENTANVFRYIDTTTFTPQRPDRVILKYSDKPDEVVNIKYVDGCDENQVKVTFVNRFGALQQMWFYGAYKTSIATSKETYPRNILSSGSYDTTRHQTKEFNKNGKSSMKLISNWYPEESNGTFMELMLSEHVWVSIDNNLLNQNKYAEQRDITFPVIIKNQDLQFKTRRNDGLISYEFDVEFASDRINSVR